jgi:sporulation-control protein spo0M
VNVFDKFNAAVGTGVARVKVTIENKADAYYWGDAVRGTVHVTGGQLPQTASDIRVLIHETWSSDENRDQREHSAQTLAGEMLVDVKSNHEFPFEIAVPSVVDLSHDWSVKAHMRVPRAVDHSDCVTFKLLPSPAIMALATALQEAVPLEMSEMANTYGFKTAWGYGQPTSKVTMKFKPSSALKSDLDGASLIVTEEDGCLRCEIEINRQEKSAVDHLKALTRQDRVRHSLDFPPGQSALESDGKAPPEVVTRLREVFAPYLS